MKTYEFKVTLAGSGDNPDEAWLDAVEGFTQDPGPTPEPEDIQEIEEDEAE
jgi:hypothetical protein